ARGDHAEADARGRLRVGHWFLSQPDIAGGSGARVARGEDLMISWQKSNDLAERARLRAEAATARPRRSSLRSRASVGGKACHSGRDRLKASRAVWYGGRSGGNNSVVECDLAKVEVAGSNPVSRSNLRSRLQAEVVHHSPQGEGGPTERVSFGWQ